MTVISTSSVEASRPISHPHLQFRPDIEGLRGVSVAAVVLFHAFPAQLPGGFIGVDVFFVISGFLITSILADEYHAKGRMDLLEFWCRRIRRILPAATLALFLTALLVWFTPALDVRQIGTNITAAALFYLNWRQADKGVDYLAAEDGENPVLHYWSLAVEEQFYLVWPLLLGAILLISHASSRRRTTMAPAIAVAVMAALLLGWSEVLAHTDRSHAFFNTFSRAWQLLAGALVALAAGLIDTRTWPSWAAGLLNAVCLVVLAACFARIDASQPYPGVWAFVPTAASALLIWSGTHPLAWGNRLLALPGLRGLGRVSFSLYLLHWPLLVVAHARFGGSTAVTISAVVLALVLSIAAFALVEKPIRTSSSLAASRRKTFALGATLVATGALAGVALDRYGPDDVRVAPDVYVSAEAIVRDRPVIYDDGCLVRQDDANGPACLYGVEAAKRTVALFGDSHAANWFPALEKAASDEGWRLLVRTRAACMPVDDEVKRADGSPYTACRTWRDYAIESIHAAKPDLIVMGGSSNAHPEITERRVIEKLAAIAPTIILRDIPRLPEPPVTCLKRKKDPRACRWAIGKLAGRTYPKTRDIDLPRNARVLDLNAGICPQGMCDAVFNEWGLMTDRRHLTTRTSRSFADKFAIELRAAATRHPPTAPAP